VPASPTHVEIDSAELVEEDLGPIITIRARTTTDKAVTIRPATIQLLNADGAVVDETDWLPPFVSSDRWLRHRHTPMTDADVAEASNPSAVVADILTPAGNVETTVETVGPPAEVSFENTASAERELTLAGALVAGNGDALDPTMETVTLGAGQRAKLEVSRPESLDLDAYDSPQATTVAPIDGVAVYTFEEALDAF